MQRKLGGYTTLPLRAQPTRLGLLVWTPRMNYPGVGRREQSRFIVRWRWRREPHYMTDETWTCVECGETFEAEDDWTEEERLAELKREFGSQVSAADCVIICDDCHQLFMEHWKALQS